MKFLILSICLILCSCTSELQMHKWKNGKIPYIFNSSFTDTQKEKIRSCMKEWEDASLYKIEFIEYSNLHNAPRNSLNINTTKYNNSCTIGDNSENNILSLNVLYLTNHVIILHELAHAIGLFHEHQRPDRDNFIIIYYDKIAKGHEDQYDLNSEIDYVNFYNYKDYNFDYDSIVLYRYPISDKLGITAITGGNHISAIDKQKVYDMY